MNLSREWTSDYGVVIRSTQRPDEQVSMPGHFAIDLAGTAALRGT
jgi:hypothetical protein